MIQHDIRQFFRLSEFFYPVLARLDIGAGDDSNSVVSSSRTIRPCSPWGSMDWTVEDMVDGLFCK